MLEGDMEVARDSAGAAACGRSAVPTELASVPCFRGERSLARARSLPCSLQFAKLLLRVAALYPKVMRASAD